jgi:DNA-binding MurR/RpiR family transcriptional regulator
VEQILFENLVKEKFTQLSAGQKKVATYLIGNLDKATYQTAYQIGREAEVSETTVIRFSYALGFEGFSKLQSRIQKQQIQQNKMSTTTREVINHSKEEKDTFTKVIEKEIHILGHLLNPMSVKNIWRTVDTLIEADQILIAGHGISHVAAHWFSHALGSIRGNVSLCSLTGDFFEKFSNLTEKSVVVVFSFPRYAKETLKIAECTRKQGISLISVTDRLLSPVGRISTITLTTEENVETGMNSIASVISLLDLVIAGIYEKDKKRIQIHQQKLEKLYSNYEVFVE